MPLPIPLEMDTNGLALKEGRFGDLFQGLYLRILPFCAYQGQNGKNKIAEKNMQALWVIPLNNSCQKSHQRTCSGTIYESENDDPEEDEWDDEEDIITVSDERMKMNMNMN